MKDLILAHDLGTTGNKASLFDSAGRLLRRYLHGADTVMEIELAAELRPFVAPKGSITTASNITPPPNSTPSTR